MLKLVGISLHHPVIYVGGEKSTNQIVPTHHVTEVAPMLIKPLASGLDQPGWDLP